jgi:hypothetical protein
VQDRKLRLAVEVRLSRLFGAGRVGIAWSTVAVLGGRPCPAIGGSLGWVSVVGVEEGRALAKAHSGPGGCSEAEPGRYRARLVLGCVKGCQNPDSRFEPRFQVRTEVDPLRVRVTGLGTVRARSPCSVTFAPLLVDARASTRNDLTASREPP